MTRLYQLLLSGLPVLFSLHLQAQTANDKFSSPVITDSMTVNPEQNRMWRTGQAKYSAKPKSMWELGINGGTSFVAGDVDAKAPAGYGFGLHLRKAINYTLSWRFEALYTISEGFDPRSFNFLAYERTYEQNFAESPQLIGYTNESIESDNIHRNYKSEILDLSFEFILNMGNILFHSPTNKWNLYGIFGVGVNVPKTYVDLLQADGSLYDFSGVTEGLDLTTNDGRNEARKNLKELLDGDFETAGGVENTVLTVEGGDKKNVIPHVTVGAGISRKLSKRLNLSLEHRALLTDSDLYDGFEDRNATSESTSNDLPNYTSLRLGINLGSFEKRVEPLYWVNPLDGAFNDVADLKQRPKFDLTDTDGDGVIDMTDQELNTMAGCPVDTRGVTLDSDGDSIADCKDQEPYSPPGFPVDDKGVAKVENDYMTEPEVVDLINRRTAAMAASLNWFLPMIHFDLDKYYIKPEFYGSLHNVAGVMKSHPDLKVVATGFADNRSDSEYNNVLSYNRANEAINYLVTNYNIPRDRFILNYRGEDEPLAKDVKDKVDLPVSEEYKQYVNRRVEFRVATPTDTDMSRPAGPDAGKNTPGSARPGSKYSGNYNSGY